MDASLILRPPTVTDGPRLWEIARDSQVLDVNSPYAYVLWCRDFAATSLVAESTGRVVGFVTGYRRPAAPATFFLWQVAVDADQRGRRLAARMVHHLLDRLWCPTDGSIPVRRLETTVTPGNTASRRLFDAVARDRGLRLEHADLFGVDVLPGATQPEELHIIH